MNGVLYIERSEQFRLTRSLSFSLNFCALFWVWCAVLFNINFGQPCPLYSLPSLKFRFPVYINYLPLGLVCGSLSTNQLVPISPQLHIRRVPQQLQLQLQMDGCDLTECIQWVQAAFFCIYSSHLRSLLLRLSCRTEISF